MCHQSKDQSENGGRAAWGRMILPRISFHPCVTVHAYLHTHTFLPAYLYEYKRTWAQPLIKPPQHTHAHASPLCTPDTHPPAAAALGWAAPAAAPPPPPQAAPSAGRVCGGRCTASPVAWCALCLLSRCSPAWGEGRGVWRAQACCIQRYRMPKMIMYHR